MTKPHKKELQGVRSADLVGHLLILSILSGTKFCGPVWPIQG